MQWSGIDHATFNGSSTCGPGQRTRLVKALNWDQNTRPCWSVARPGGRRLVTYRADVLRFLPIVTTAGSPNKGKFDLSQPLDDRRCPTTATRSRDDDELGTENPAITGARAIGASLVVLYRDPTRPLRGVVIYDGGFTKTAFATMTLDHGGLRSGLPRHPDAKLTAIVGDGRPFLSERVRVNGTLVATNPFASTDGAEVGQPDLRRCRR